MHTGWCTTCYRHPHVSTFCLLAISPVFDSKKLSPWYNTSVFSSMLAADFCLTEHSPVFVCWWWPYPQMSADILGTNCGQCLSMVQCCFTSTETVRLIRTGSPGWLPQLSHSSWTLYLSVSQLFFLYLFTLSVVTFRPRVFAGGRLDPGSWGPLETTVCRVQHASLSWNSPRWVLRLAWPNHLAGSVLP